MWLEGHSALFWNRDDPHIVEDGTRPYFRNGKAVLIVARWTLELVDQKCSQPKVGICDVGIVVAPVERQRNKYRRVGYFEEHYQRPEPRALFAGDREEVSRRVVLV